ncbi:MULTISPECIES: UPF0280 family protein [Mesorhizobium]|uniref:UPF0280 family protein n=1 Tax=Mesorhizobium denitrificans TaxID=2294114 RepID=A0A371XK98_9HYPH|nr:MULTISPECIES: UPF0280 family protein [Mesorhizobium]RFC69642.1 UPF0280 family protein [Mesorhizobium denitrificans]
MSPPQATMLGRRLHLNHGPIDIIAEAFGEGDEVQRAYHQAVARFGTILDELVAELPNLRAPVHAEQRAFGSKIAQSMEAAAQVFFPAFITPMAAVAGAVADEVLAHMIAGRRLKKAYVNNGGDSALYLGAGANMSLAIAGTGNDFEDRIFIGADDETRGVATSGWRGRSFSLGIADAVTVLARTGTEADAAATIIANAVDLPGHGSIRRAPAESLQPDSDLGGRLVTVDVGNLTAQEAARALEAGLRKADELRTCGLISAAALFLNSQWRMTQGMPVAMPPQTQALSGSLQNA